MIAAETRKRTTKEWLELLEGSGMPYAAVNDVKDTLESQHGECLPPVTSLLRLSKLSSLRIARARKMTTTLSHPHCGQMTLVNTPIKYSSSTPGVRSPPPTLGQHTDEVLEGILGMSRQEISILREGGVVA